MIGIYAHPLSASLAMQRREGLIHSPSALRTQWRIEHRACVCIRITDNFMQEIAVSVYNAYACNRVRSRSGYKLLTLGFEVHGFALQQGKRRTGKGIPGGCSSPSNGPTKRAAARPVVAAARRDRSYERARGR